MNLKDFITFSIIVGLTSNTHIITEVASLMEVDDMSHQEVEDVVASLAGIENINNPSLIYSYIDFNTRVIGK